jgi:hypothetical protein
MSYYLLPLRGLGDTEPSDCQGPGVYWDPDTGECASAPVPECPNGTITQTTDAAGNPVSPMYCVPWPSGGGGGGTVVPTPEPAPAPAPAPAPTPTPTAAVTKPIIGNVGIGILAVLGAVVVGALVLA